MENMFWCGYEWITSERWGQVHPDKSHWWYDESCVEIDKDNYLHLTTKYNPKYFPEIDKNATIGVGLVSCTTKFGFGIYSITAKLPKGENLWPAFWMWSWDSWPPEIDVFEAYSDSKGSYLKPRLSKPLGFWNVQTNVHYKEGDSNKMTGGKTHYFGFKDPSKHFIEYTLIWQKDAIKLYYDNRLVRTITDKNILDQFNKTKMNVILNNGVTEDVDRLSPPNSDFIIKKFKYSPIFY